MHRPTLQLGTRLQRLYRRLACTEKSVYRYMDVGHRRTRHPRRHRHQDERGHYRIATLNAPEIEPVSAKTRQEAQNMGSFKHNQKNYPRLQFWQIDDAYFNNPDSINTLVRLPDAWRIRPTQKSEHHFDNRQMQLLRS